MSELDPKRKHQRLHDKDVSMLFETFMGRKAGYEKKYFIEVDLTRSKATYRSTQYQLPNGGPLLSCIVDAIGEQKIARWELG